MSSIPAKTYPLRLPRGSLRIAEMAGSLPLLRSLLRAAYARRFDGAQGQIRMFRGVYPDFQSAARTIPGTRLTGYDNEPSALRLEDERLRITSSDYPIMFWLSQLLPHSKLLLDWGGNVGISYFGFRRYLCYAPDFTWLVNDVPAVVARGRVIAARESAPHLRFTTSLNELAQADVLLAGGSLHFIEDPFSILRAAAALPGHILVNKVPVYDRASAVTVQNIGSALCPNHLFNRAEFVLGFERLGYELSDQWNIADLSCHIPFFSSHSIAAYSGFYFRRVSG
jgi:putative methyltransferase (TIGR04325 family)